MGDLAPSGQKARVRANLEALRTLRELQTENRPATADEQQLLARWGGWGAVPNVFEESGPKAAEFEAERAELKRLLTPKEYNEARRNTLNAHYTDPAYAEAMWDALGELGLTEGRVLEPGSGAGTFIGLRPEGVEMIGVELDSSTAGIAAKLYPDANIIQEGFEETLMPDGAIDGAIGNVPFGDWKLLDPKYNPGRKHSIHNHFITKSLQMTRPGGMVALLTSRHTLDSADPAARTEMAKLGDLVGAVRLPNSSHRRASGTDVVIDMLVFRRHPEPPRRPDVDDEGFEHTNYAARFNAWTADREAAEAARDLSWLHTVEQTVPGGEKDGPGTGTVVMNEWFAEHPEMVLGETRAEVGQYGMELTVRAGTEDVPAEFRDALDKVVADAKKRGLTATQRPESEPLPEIVNLASAHLEGHLSEGTEEYTRTVTVGADGKTEIQPRVETTKFTQIRNGAVVPHFLPHSQKKEHSHAAQAAELGGLVKLRDVSEALLTAESESDVDTPEIDRLREELNRVYDAHVKEHGYPSRRTVSYRNQKLRKDEIDPDTGETVPAGETVVRTQVSRPPQGGFALTRGSARVYGLEKFDVDSQTAKKADIFFKRTVAPRAAKLTADNPVDALAITLDQGQGVNLRHVADLLNVDEAEARRMLGTLVFDAPTDADPDLLVPAAEYLSGDVRQKLRDAEALAATDGPRFAENVEALKAVVPEGKTPDRIKARMGTPWVGAEDVQLFLREALGEDNIRVKKTGAKWEVKGSAGVLGTTVWGTERRNALEIAEFALAGKRPKINGLERHAGKERSTGKLDPKATEAAQDKVDAMNERFQAWLWEDPDRSDRLVTHYNNVYHSLALRQYDREAPRDLPGLAKKFTFRPHQHTAVHRVVNEPAVLLAHEVGAGKTLEMIASSMELKRLGLAKKPVHVIPNHMLEQYSREFLEGYPGANILVATQDEMQGRYRREFVAKCATGNWDAIIITHNAFEKIPLSPEAQAAYIDREMQVHRENAEAEKKAIAEGGGSKNSKEKKTKAIENQLIKFESRLKAKLAKDRDTGISFEETGIDYVFLDEAHLYKNLMTPSSVEDISIDGSGRASDMHMKLDHLRHRNKSNRVATFATATPISNSVAEMYIMTRYLRPDLLEAQSVRSFDDWAAMHARVKSDLEITPGGGFRMKDRLADIVNVGELLRVFHSYADVKTAADLKLPTPSIRGGKPEAIAVDRSDELADYIQTLADRAKDLEGKSRRDMMEKGADNHLAINTDGRLAALDLRLVGIEGAANPKIEAAADNIARIFEENRDRKFAVEGTQDKDDKKYLIEGTGEVHDTPGALQIVFCDLGTPGEKAVKKDENGNVIPDRTPIDPRTGKRFNVYDELRNQLVDRGVPRSAIKFIHEAKNDSEKARMFEDARTGKIAVLLGSTEKMGVGTNVQNRAVALHHLDCPWRPTDLTQRNGRIIRQNNQNREVGIYNYMVKDTLDAKSYGTVTRKAGFIGPMMAGDLEMDEIEDLGTSGSTLAEFQAIAANNPHLTEKIYNDVALKKATGAEFMHEQAQRSLELNAKKYRGQAKRAQREIETLETAIAQREDTTGDLFTMTVAGMSGGTYSPRFDVAVGTKIDKRKEAGEALAEALGKVANPNLYLYGQQRVGHIGGFDILAERQRDRESGKQLVMVHLDGVPGSSFSMFSPEKAGGSLMRSLEDRLRGMDSSLRYAKADLAGAEKKLPLVERNIGVEFPRKAELDYLRIRAGLLDDIMAVYTGTSAGEDDADVELSDVERDKSKEQRDRETIAVFDQRLRELDARYKRESGSGAAPVIPDVVDELAALDAQVTESRLDAPPPSRPDVPLPVAAGLDLRPDRPEPAVAEDPDALPVTPDVPVDITPPAPAAPAAPETPDDEARRLSNESAAANKAGEHDRALELLDQAEAVSPTYKLPGQWEQIRARIRSERKRSELRGTLPLDLSGPPAPEPRKIQDGDRVRIPAGARSDERNIAYTKPFVMQVHRVSRVLGDRDTVALGGVLLNDDGAPARRDSLRHVLVRRDAVEHLDAPVAPTADVTPAEPAVEAATPDQGSPAAPTPAVPATPERIPAPDMTPPPTDPRRAQIEQRLTTAGIPFTTEPGKDRATVVQLPDGTVVTRKSQTRDYTHAVVRTVDQHAEADLLDQRADKTERFGAAVAEIVASGDLSKLNRKATAVNGRGEWSYSSYLKEFGYDEVLWLPDWKKPGSWEEYAPNALARIAARPAELRAKAAELRGRDRYGYEVMRWSSTQDAADKAANGWAKDDPAARYDVVEAGVDDRARYRVEGRLLTVEQAADRYLTGDSLPQPAPAAPQVPAAATDGVTVTRTRRSIGGQLEDHWNANGIEWTTESVVTPAYPDGRLLYVVEGEKLTPGEAADKYLPGGFDGSYGGNGTAAPDRAPDAPDQAPAATPDADPFAPFSAPDRATIEHVIQDHLGRYYGGPLNLSRADAVRYTVEGHLKEMQDKYGRRETWDAVEAYVAANVDSRPELLQRLSDAQIAERNAARDEEAKRLNLAANDAFKAGDYSAALDLINQAEQAAPDYRGGAARWARIREVIQAKKAAAAPAADTTPLETPAPAPTDSGLVRMETGPQRTPEQSVEDHRRAIERAQAEAAGLDPDRWTSAGLVLKTTAGRLEPGDVIYTTGVRDGTVDLPGVWGGGLPADGQVARTVDRIDRDSAGQLTVHFTDGTASKDGRSPGATLYSAGNKMEPTAAVPDVPAPQRAIQITDRGNESVITGTSFGDDPRVRQAIKDNRYRWKKADKEWRRDGTPEERRAAANAVTAVLDEVDREQAAEAEAALPAEFPPTDQQQLVYDAVDRGEDVVVRALAGTGKTTTLIGIAKRHPEKKMLYVAFNRAIKEEAAGKFPANTKVSTSDALAFHALDDAHKKRIMKGERRPQEVAKILRLDGVADGFGTGELANAALGTVRAWTISDDDELSAKHIPNGILGTDAPHVQKQVLEAARLAWADLESPTGKLYFSHEHSMKMWALSKPVLPYQLLFFDEAQDTNNVLAGIVRRQDAQKVVVGDSNQSIYAFRGATDVLDRWNAPADLPLTKSWRFGPEIADAGNRFLELLDSPSRVEGNGGKTSVIGEIDNPDAILTRTNAGAVGAIAEALADGKKVATSGDAKELISFARAAGELVAGRRTSHPDLSMFRAWDQVRDHAEETGDGNMQTFVRLVDARGADGLIGLLEKLVPEFGTGENAPDVTISTAHKSKGREWPSVRIHSDFKGPKVNAQTGQEEMPNAEELRLAYVAVTRAEQNLDPGSLSWVYDYTQVNGGEPDAAPTGPKVPDAPTPAPVAEAPEPAPAPATATITRAELDAVAADGLITPPAPAPAPVPEPERVDTPPPAPPTPAVDDTRKVEHDAQVRSFVRIYRNPDADAAAKARAIDSLAGIGASDVISDLHREQLDRSRAYGGDRQAHARYTKLAAYLDSLMGDSGAPVVPELPTIRDASAWAAGHLGRPELEPDLRALMSPRFTESGRAASARLTELGASDPKIEALRITLPTASAHRVNGRRAYDPVRARAIAQRLAAGDKSLPVFAVGQRIRADILDKDAPIRVRLGPPGTVQPPPATKSVEFTVGRISDHGYAIQVVSAETHTELNAYTGHPHQMPWSVSVPADGRLELLDVDQPATPEPVNVPEPAVEPERVPEPVSVPDAEPTGAVEPTPAPRAPDAARPTDEEREALDSAVDSAATTLVNAQDSGGANDLRWTASQYADAWRYGTPADQDRAGAGLRGALDVAGVQHADNPNAVKKLNAVRSSMSPEQATRPATAPVVTGPPVNVPPAVDVLRSGPDPDAPDEAIYGIRGRRGGRAAGPRAPRPFKSTGKAPLYTYQRRLINGMRLEGDESEDVRAASAALRGYQALNAAQARALAGAIRRHGAESGDRRTERSSITAASRMDILAASLDAGAGQVAGRRPAGTLAAGDRVSVPQFGADLAVHGTVVSARQRFAGRVTEMEIRDDATGETVVRQVLKGTPLGEAPETPTPQDLDASPPAVVGPQRATAIEVGVGDTVALPDVDRVVQGEVTQSKALPDGSVMVTVAGSDGVETPVLVPDEHPVWQLPPSVETPVAAPRAGTGWVAVDGIQEGDIVWPRGDEDAAIEVESIRTEGGLQVLVGRNVNDDEETEVTVPAGGQVWLADRDQPLDADTTPAPDPATDGQPETVNREQIDRGDYIRVRTAFGETWNGLVLDGYDEDGQDPDTGETVPGRSLLVLRDGDTAGVTHNLYGDDTVDLLERRGPAAAGPTVREVRVSAIAVSLQLAHANAPSIAAQVASRAILADSTLTPAQVAGQLRRDLVDTPDTRLGLSLSVDRSERFNEIAGHGLVTDPDRYGDLSEAIMPALYELQRREVLALADSLEEAGEADATQRILGALNSGGDLSRAPAYQREADTLLRLVDEPGVSGSTRFRPRVGVARQEAQDTTSGAVAKVVAGLLDRARAATKDTTGGDRAQALKAFRDNEGARATDAEIDAVLDAALPVGGGAHRQSPTLRSRVLTGLARAQRREMNMMGIGTASDQQERLDDIAADLVGEVDRFLGIEGAMDIVPPAPVPHPAGSLTDRIARYRRALPGDGTDLGRRTVKRTATPPITLQNLAAGAIPAPVSVEMQVADVAADGGPGVTALRNLEVVKAAGHVLDDEMQERIRKLLHAEPADIMGPVEADLAEAQENAAQAWKQFKIAGTAVPAELAKRQQAAQAARDEAHRKVADARRAAALETLAKIRPMGSGPGAVVKYDQERGQLLDAVRWAEQHFPTDWLRRAGAGTKVKLKPSTRGHHDPRGKSGRPEIALSKGAEQVTGSGPSGRVAVHELAHHMEAVVPGLSEMQNAYLWQRTTDEGTEVGTRTRTGRNSVSRLAGQQYRNEHGRRDEFPDHYSGKEYGRGHYELLTTGMESLFAGSDYADDDHRRWLLGVLATVGTPTPDAPAAPEQEPTPDGPLDGIDLSTLTDDQLSDLIARHGDDEQVLEQLFAELERRDAGPDVTPEEAAISALMAKGVDFMAAYSEVHGVELEELQRQERQSAVDVDRQAGETRDATVKRIYDEWVEVQTIAASNATGGNLLSKAGRAQHVDPETLFSGPPQIARKYASEELKRWWEENGRMTYTEFKADMLGRASDVAAAAASKLTGNGRDFGL
jgi:N12 class adenine-specific DNA methylase